MHDNDNPDNIFLKNPDYAELTALYSMWKNCRADVQGLFHYRRYVAAREEKLSEDNSMIVIAPNDITKTSITAQRILKELEHADVILASPTTAPFVNAAEQFRAACGWENIRTLCEVTLKYYPEYMQSLLEVLNGNHISQYNIL